MKWFREWRAWVGAQQIERERKLVGRIVELMDSKDYSDSFYRARDIIYTIRRHDRRDD